ncbi:MAG: hypothetical protein U0822_27650 [Anaerolineae bacterium]
MKILLRFTWLVLGSVSTLAFVALVLSLPTTAPAAAVRADGSPTPAASLFLPLLARHPQNDPPGQWTRYDLPGAAPKVNRLVMSSASSGWAAGSVDGVGAIWRFDGAAWHLENLPPSGTLTGLAVVSDADVWAVGAGIDTPGAMLHWDGSAWTLTPWRPESLTAIIALSASDAWAVGVDPATKVSAAVYHWNGAAWTPFPAPAPNFAAGLFSAVNANDIWLTAINGYTMGNLGLIHWNGAAWATEGTPSAPRWGFSIIAPDDGWETFGLTGCTTTPPRGAPPCESMGAIDRWSGGTWQPGILLHDYGINDVQAITPDLAWGIGYGDSVPRGFVGPVTHTARLLRWNGQTWSVIDTRPGEPLSLMSVVAPNDIWASDREAAILHYPAR